MESQEASATLFLIPTKLNEAWFNLISNPKLMEVLWIKENDEFIEIMRKAKETDAAETAAAEAAAEAATAAAEKAAAAETAAAAEKATAEKAAAAAEAAAEAAANGDLDELKINRDSQQGTSSIIPPLPKSAAAAEAATAAEVAAAPVRGVKVTRDELRTIMVAQNDILEANGESIWTPSMVNTIVNQNPVGSQNAIKGYFFKTVRGNLTKTPTERFERLHSYFDLASDGKGPEVFSFSEETNWLREKYLAKPISASSRSLVTDSGASGSTADGDNGDTGTSANENNISIIQEPEEGGAPPLPKSAATEAAGSEAEEAEDQGESGAATTAANLATLVEFLKTRVNKKVTWTDKQLSNIINEGLTIKLVRGMFYAKNTLVETKYDATPRLSDLQSFFNSKLEGAAATERNQITDILNTIPSLGDFRQGIFGEIPSISSTSSATVSQDALDYETDVENDGVSQRAEAEV